MLNDIIRSTLVLAAIAIGCAAAIVIYVLFTEGHFIPKEFKCTEYSFIGEVADQQEVCIKYEFNLDRGEGL